MRIAVGQDAFGLWAWMVLDERDRCVESDDAYHEAALAMEDALNALDRITRAEKRRNLYR